MLTSLRRHLTTLAGHDIPIAEILEHPTPHALAHHLSRTATAGDATQPSAGTGRYEVDTAVRRAIGAGQGGEAMHMLASLASIMPTFAGPGEIRGLPAADRIAAGPGLPVLVCLRTIMPSLGGFEYTRFAALFQGSRDVYLAPRPGFEENERLPATLEALVAAQTEAVLKCVHNRPFVLVGHSSGGLIGHLVAGHLERQGRPPAGIALLDTAVLRRITPEVLSESMRENYDAWGDYLSRSAQGLAAMGTYYRLLAQCEPRPIATPSLVVFADAGLSAAPQEAFPARWTVADTAVTGHGTHLTIMSDHATTTAQIVKTWVDKLETPS
jgi:pimeloyl-ACP methyl ester carboxylesterase